LACKRSPAFETIFDFWTNLRPGAACPQAVRS
jgi:hypothetical protein